MRPSQPSPSSDGYNEPQASYPVHPGSYGAPTQLPDYTPGSNMPVQPYPYQNGYPAHSPQQPMSPYAPQQPMSPYAPQQPASPYNSQQPMSPYAPQQIAPQYQGPGNSMPQSMNVNINNVQNGYAQEVYDPHRGQATTALALGIVAIIIWIIPVIGTLTALICASIGIIMGIKGIRSTTRSGSAITGIILSILSLLFIIAEVMLFGLPLIALLFAQNSIHHTIQP